MPQTTTVKPVEQSVCFITVTFTDEDAASVVPDSITWSLSDSNGRIINSRDAVSIVTPAASIDIVLSGADLAIDSLDLDRHLTIEAIYDSALQANVPSKDELKFTLANLIGVT